MTLPELLTGISAIVVLWMIYSVFSPPIGSRHPSREAATRAILMAISTGCEMFKNDEGEYPPSNPASFGDGRLGTQDRWQVRGLSGANLLADAMIGRDLNGYDPSPDNEADIRWSDGDAVPRKRRTAYITPDKITVSDVTDHPPVDGFGLIPIDLAMPRPDHIGPRTKMILDRWGYPILYYRANPRATNLTRMLQLETERGRETIGSGIYDGRDNAVFTGHSADGQRHDMADAFAGVPATEPLGGYASAFARFIRSSRASDSAADGRIRFSRPVNPDTFILLSPGRDGRWGGGDDVANFDSCDR